MNRGDIVEKVKRSHRMKNRWKIIGEDAILYFERNNGEVWEALVDVYSLYRLFHLGSTWSVTGKSKDSFYIHSNIKGKYTTLHRYLMGNPEGMEIDHINGIKQDNRICNMRVVTRGQNSQNLSPYSKSISGYRGVRYCRADERWTAEITIDGKPMYLGSFESKESACQRVAEVRKVYMPYSAREIV